MKKIMMTAVMVFSAVIALTACGNNTGNETADEEETVTGKTMSQDFDSSTNQTIYVGDVALEIPSTWAAQEDNTENEAAYWVEDSMFYIRRSEFYGEVTDEENANLLAETIDETFGSFNVEGTNSGLIDIPGDKSALYYEGTGTIEDTAVTVYAIMASFENNTTCISFNFLDSDESLYDHSEDYFSVINSMYYPESVEGTTAEKPVAQDFNASTNQTLYFGDVAFQIPSTWVAAADNTEDDMTFWVDSTMFYATYSEFYGEITEEESANEMIASMEAAIDADDLERLNYSLVNILGGDKTAVYYEATCTVNGTAMHLYFVAVSVEDNSHVLTCALYDSDVSEYDHSEDFFSAMNSMYYL